MTARILCLALLGAFIVPALTAPPAVAAGGPEAYLAYRIRVARGEAHYRLDAGLTRLAEKRAQEIALGAFAHRYLTEVPCGWGEVVAWSSREPITSVRWVMSAWRRSATHWAVITGAWGHYGVGTYYRNGAWYMAVVFAQCRIGAAA